MGLPSAVACLSHLTVSLALSENRKDLVRLPSGRSLREAMFKVVEIGPLHDFLEKGCE